MNPFYLPDTRLDMMLRFIADLRVDPATAPPLELDAISIAVARDLAITFAPRPLSGAARQRIWQRALTEAIRRRLAAQIEPATAPVHLAHTNGRYTDKEQIMLSTHTPTQSRLTLPRERALARRLGALALVAAACTLLIAAFALFGLPDLALPGESTLSGAGGGITVTKIGPEVMPLPDSNWVVSTPEEQGMRSDELAALFETFMAPGFYTDSMLVVRHGVIVAEAYAPYNQPDTRQQLYASSQSVLGALVGAAIQDGYFTGADQPVLDVLPDLPIPDNRQARENMTLADLLTMQTGLDCRDYDNWQTTDQMVVAEDWLQYAFELPLIRAPGHEWKYCYATSYMLSAVITAATGQSALDYAAGALFEPLGITDYAWLSNDAGVSYGFSELQLTPRDLAKIGQLYMQGGAWNGEQLIPAEYVETSLATQTPVNPGWGYGYHWWHDTTADVYLSAAWDGQYLILVPEKDLMVVVMGGLFEPVGGFGFLEPLVTAVAALTVAEEPLTADPAETAHLADVLRAINQPSAQPVPPPPALASEISGTKYYVLETDLLTIGAERWLDWRGQTVDFEMQALMLTFNEPSEAVFTLTDIAGREIAFPVGLDDLYRVSLSDLGQVAAKGMWLTDDTFRVYVKLIGDAYMRRIDVTFLPGSDMIEVVSQEYASGAAVGMQGMTYRLVVGN